MNTPDQALFEKIKQLPPQRLAEVEDFVDFLHTREAEVALQAGNVYLNRGITGALVRRQPFGGYRL